MPEKINHAGKSKPDLPSSPLPSSAVPPKFTPNPRFPNAPEDLIPLIFTVTRRRSPPLGAALEAPRPGP